MPHARGDGLARPWIKRHASLEHRIGGIEKQPGTGNIDYSPAAHQEMTDTATPRCSASPTRSRPGRRPRARGRGARGDRLGLDLRPDPPGGAPGDRVRQDVAYVHVRHIWPPPKNLGDLLKSFKKVIVPEMNMGQYKTLLRDQYLVDAQPLTKVSGHPFRIAEIEAAIDRALA